MSEATHYVIWNEEDGERMAACGEYGHLLAAVDPTCRDCRATLAIADEGGVKIGSDEDNARLAEDDAEVLDAADVVEWEVPVTLTVKARTADEAKQIAADAVAQIAQVA